MAKQKPVIARNSAELARILGLKPADAHQWDVQIALLQRLKGIIAERGYTHAQVAEKAGTSRTRVTGILNGNLQSVSSDLLIRLIGSLGYSVKVSVTKRKVAA